MFTSSWLHCWWIVMLLRWVLSTPNAIGSSFEKREDVIGLPSILSACAKDCIFAAFTGTSIGCAHADFPCLCKSQSFLNGSADCLGSSCTTDEKSIATDWTAKTCASLGVNVSTVINNTIFQNVTRLQHTNKTDAMTSSANPHPVGGGATTNSHPISETATDSHPVNGSVPASGDTPKAAANSVSSKTIASMLLVACSTLTTVILSN